MIRDGRPGDAVHVTAGVITKNGKILIARRPAGKHLEGLWEFPGGKREPGETLRKCLVREIREELNIVVEPLSLIMTSAHEYPEKSVVLHFFDCRLPAGEPTAVQGQELRWVKPQELGLFDFPPPDWELIERLGAHIPPM